MYPHPRDERGRDRRQEIEIDVLAGRESYHYEVRAAGPDSHRAAGVDAANSSFTVDEEPLGGVEVDGVNPAGRDGGIHPDGDVAQRSAEDAADVTCRVSADNERRGLVGA